MAKKVQLMTNAKEWQTVNGVEVLIDVPQEDLDPITDSSCVEIEGHRTLEETINQDNMFTPEIVETKIHSKVGGVYHDNVVDGAYEEAILYGNTQVNLVESVTTGSKYIPHSFTSFQGNESKIGNYHSGRTNQVAPLVKGVTMVNLCQSTSVTLSCQHTTAVANHNAKPNTKYTLKCKFTEKNKNAGIMIQSYGYKDGTWGYIEISKTIQNLGDDVLLTFTTHEQADSIIIYNNPAFCEDANDSITLDDIMVIEGDVTDLDLPFFKGMRSVELSRPLTNLLHDGIYKTYGSTTQLNYSNGNVTVTANAIGTWQSANFHFINEDELKPNTKYIVMWDSLTQTQTSTSSGSIIAVYDTKSGDGDINIGTANSKSECPVLRSIVFDTTGRDASGIVLRIHATLSNSETGTTTVTGLRVFEWDDSLRTLDLQTIGYFSGTKYVSARTLETEGKNLYPYGDASFTATNTNVDSWYDHKGTAYMHGDIALKSKSRFLLKQGTYTITTGVWVSATACQLIDDKEQIVVKLDSGQRNHVFTLSQDTYCTLRIKASVVNTVTQIPNIQIERGETATAYEAYNSRYYKPRETEEIILRSLPNGVCDTFNLQTGELVQKIYYLTVKNGFTVLSNFTTDTHATFAWSLSANNVQCKNNMVFYSNYPSATTYTTDSVEGVAINSAGNQLTMRIAKSKYASYETFNGYLTDNPLIIQYELKEPIITKLQTYNRVYSGQTNALANMGNNLSALTYYSNNYCLKVGNLSPVPGILEPITSLPYDARLKPSTLYTVKYYRGGASNSMKFDLGGSVVEKTNSITSTTGIAEEFTVTTPAILSHEQLQLSGTGYAHSFIIVEGDIIGTELPYFEGMKDVKMPIVKNIGKNLWDSEFIYGTMGSNNGVFTIVKTAIIAKDITKVRPRKSFIMYNTSNYPMVIVAYDSNKQFLRTITNIHSGTIFTLGADVYYIRPRTPNTSDASNCYNDINTKIYLYEYEEGMDTTLQDYKENSIYAVQGEIPFSEDMFEQGGFNGTNKKGQSYDNCKVSANENIRIRTKDLIPVKPNTQYIISNQTLPNLNHIFYYFDGNRNYLEKQAEVNASSFTTTDDCYYVSLMLSKNNDANLSTTEFKQEQFRMYELDSTINLRSLPNGVKDELNLLTGEYIQRVGEVVLDGSDVYGKDGTIFKPGVAENTRISTTCVSFTHNSIKKRASNNDIGHLKCDKLKVTSVVNTYTNEVEGVSQGGNGQYIQICLNNDKLSSYDLVGVQAYLQSNPITVQYELAEPIISHVRLVSNNQEREVGVKLPNGVSNTYNPSTGMTTVRVGKVVLDGSESYSTYEGSTGITATTPQMLTVWTTEPISDAKLGVVGENPRIGAVLSSGFPYFGPLAALDSRNQEMHFISHTGRLNFNIALSKLPTHDISGLKTYLASNPITVWYELKYPQIQPDIVLPNGVHDEYNPETGVYTKKVGFIEFDGSEDENWKLGGAGSGTEVNTKLFLSPCPQAKTIPTKSDCKIVCDSLGFLYELYDTDKEGIHIFANTTHIAIRVSKNKLSEVTVNGLSSYLSQNPLKVWFELSTPITYQLTPYFGLPQPYAYEDGYLIHDSAYPETTLPPEFKYKLVANRTGQIVQNGRKLQEHTTRLSNLEALIIEATIQSLFDRELQTFELELMDIQLIDLGE